MVFSSIVKMIVIRFFVGVFIDWVLVVLSGFIDLNRGKCVIRYVLMLVDFVILLCC